MLTFKLIKIEDGFYYYEIYAEGKKENVGRFVFNPETMELKERVEAGNYENYINMFLGHVSNKDGSLKEEGMVAWM